MSICLLSLIKPDNAQTEAQAVGRTPELCDDGSTFQLLYQACLECIAVVNNTNNDVGGYVVSNFQDYVDYCSPSVQTITAVADVTTQGALLHFTVTTVVTLSAGVNATTGQSEVTATVPITSLDTVPLTSTNSTTTPLATANSTISSSQTTATNTNLIPSAEPTTDINSNPENKAWIAGPIAGSISGVTILVLVAFLLFCRRRRRRNAMKKPSSDEYTDKPQLHSDCVPRAPPDELDAGMRHELPGDEPRDENAMVTELPGKDPHKVLDKTYGRSELPAYEPGQLPS